MQNTFTLRLPAPRAGFVAAVLFASLAGSCRLTNAAVEAPGKLAEKVMHPNAEDNKPKVPISIVQEQVMRFADGFAARIAQACSEFARAAGTPEARTQALSWSIWQRSSAFTIASGENPNRNLLDMLVFVTLGRIVHEEYWGPKVWHEADAPVLEALKQSESDMWLIATRVLTKEQAERVQLTLKNWRETHPDTVFTGAVRMPAFQELLTEHEDNSTNVLTDFATLLEFDPLSGLEPMTREVKQARLLVERMSWYAQRAQLVIPTQIELLSLRMTNAPDVQTAIAAADRISKAVESLSQTAQTLPDSVRVEREAAVKQISEELGVQREGIVADLEKVHGPANDLMKQAQATLEAGTQMSGALQSAITTLDQFVASVSPPKKPGDAAVIDASAPAPPKGKGFDVTEYGAAAEQVGVAANNLTTLLASVDTNLPKIQKTLDEVAQRGDATIDHAYERGLRLGVILIAVAAAAALLVRWLSRGWRVRAA